jgi:hypothetical protein
VFGATVKKFCVNGDTSRSIPVVIAHGSPGLSRMVIKRSSKVSLFVKKAGVVPPVFPLTEAVSLTAAITATGFMTNCIVADYTRTKTTVSSRKHSFHQDLHWSICIGTIMSTVSLS